MARKELTFFEPITNRNKKVKGSIRGYFREKGPVRIEFTSAESKARGKGHGMRAYERLATKALSAGRKLQSDSSISPEAQRVYEGLGRRGFDVQQHQSAVRGSEGHLLTDKGEPVYTVKSGPVKQSPVFTAEEATASVGRARAAGTLKGIAKVGGKALGVTGTVLQFKDFHDTMEENKRLRKREEQGFMH